MSSTILFQTNFESTATGSVPSYLTNIGSANYQASANNPISGTKSLQDISQTNGDTAIFQNISAQDAGIRYVQTFPSNATSGQSGLMPFLRSDAGNTQGYTFLFSASGWTLFRRTSSSNANISTSITNYSYQPSPGDVFWVDAYISGSTLGIKMWKHGSAEPTSYTTFTDTGVTTVGYNGVRAGLFGGALVLILDDLTIYGGGPWAPVATTIPVSDTNFFTSAHNWDLVTPTTFTTNSPSTTVKQSNTPGAVFKAAVLGTTSLSIAVDVTTQSGNSIVAASYPQVSVSLNGLPAVKTQLVSGQTTVPVATGLDPFLAYDIEYTFVARDQYNGGDAWGTATASPINVVRVVGVIADTGASSQNLGSLLQPGYSIGFGDSIYEGKYVNNYGSTGTEPGSNDAINGLGTLIGKSFGTEYSVIGFASQGFEQSGSGNVPGFQSSSAWQYYSSGRSRLVGGLFSPMPQYITCLHGYNGTTTSSDISGFLTNVRSACAASTYVFLCVPPGGIGQPGLRATMATGYATYRAANPTDLKTIFIDPFASYGQNSLRAFNGVYPNISANKESGDGIHPNSYGASRLSAMYAGLIQQAIGNANIVLKFDGSGNVLSAAQNTSTIASSSVAALKADAEYAKLIGYGSHNFSVANPNSTTRVVTYYAADGTTVLSTHTVTLDAFGNATARTVA